MFDFEAFYKAVVIICCVTIVVGIVMMIVYFLRISKKEPVEEYHEAVPENRDLEIAFNTLCEKLDNDRYQTNETLEKLTDKLNKLEQKVDEIYIEE